MAQRKFEYSDGKSFKFWNVERKGKTVATAYGRIGIKGQKTTKGYEEVGGAGASGGTSKSGGRREFHFVSGASSKFWAIEMKGQAFDVTYGKLGTAGRTQTKEFKSAEAAEKACEKLIGEKT